MITEMKSGVYLVGKGNNLEFNLDEYLENKDFFDAHGYSRWELHIHRIPINDAGSVELSRISRMLCRLDEVPDKVERLREIQDLIDKLIPHKCYPCGRVHKNGENNEPKS